MEFAHYKFLILLLLLLTLSLAYILLSYFYAYLHNIYTKDLPVILNRLVWHYTHQYLKKKTSYVD